MVSFAIGLCQPPVPSFAALSRGDRIHIDYISNGCFHRDHFRLTFESGSPFTVTIVSVESIWLSDDRQAVEEKRLGTLNLSREDLTGLDQLIAFYRSDPGGSCTTIDKITFSHIRNGRIVVQERFTDATCSDTLTGLAKRENISIEEAFGKEQARAILKLKNVVWIRDLVERAVKKT